MKKSCVEMYIFAVEQVIVYSMWVSENGFFSYLIVYFDKTLKYYALHQNDGQEFC